MPEEIVRASSGECPICGERFDDEARFTAHLADEHDLHDEEGAESTFGVVVAAPPEPVATSPLLRAVDEEALERRMIPPERGHPVGLLALLVVALVALVGMVVLLGDDDDGERDDDVELAEDDGEEQGSASSARPGSAGASATSSTRRSSTTAPPGGGAAATTTPAPATSTTVASVTTAPLPTATTSGAPAGYVAPTTAEARVVSCERVKDDHRITYSWRFVGGSGWRAPSAYVALGGGRYRHTIQAPRRETTRITSVRVVDSGGTSHAIALRPALSSASC